ncbi:membrane-spanning 4-domains subfamily A member 4D-like isoform X2 [Hyperolius riggenbachi]|uniref:membrane-spanning 4-domains subfamily A member 4D-like isoform X2 n=1 Tax=Hyperolius riggenbachi TaxID=752182 RepID=UPI0035A2E062
MSLTPGEVNANNYKTTICENPQTTIPTPAVPLAMYRHDVNPSPPAYQGPSATQTWNVPTVAPQWIVATLVSPNVDSSAPFFQTFLKGKPKALGIVVIVAAIIEVGLGIALACIASSITVISGIPFWGAIFYIIAGSLTIAAQKKPNICLTGGFVILSLLVITNVLLFCVTFSTSIFGCRSLCKEQPQVTQIFLIQNDAVIPMTTGAAPAYCVQMPPPPPLYPVNDVKAT